MKIVVRCECGQKLAVKTSKAGKKVRCPNCETVLRIPETESAIQNVTPVAHDIPSIVPPQPIASVSPALPVGDSMGQYDVPNGRDDIPSHGHDLVYNNPMHILPKRGIFAGVEAMVFGVIHLLVAAMAMVALMQLRSVQQMHQFPRGVGGGIINVEAGISGFFTNSQITVLMFGVFMLGLCVAGIMGGIGMFRLRLWGWITVMITAGLSLLLAGFVGYQYFTVLNAMSVVQAPLIEQMNEQALNSYYSIRRQVHLAYWLLFVCYMGYAISVMRLLISEGVLDAYLGGRNTQVAGR